MSAAIGLSPIGSNDHGHGLPPEALPPAPVATAVARAPHDAGQAADRDSHDAPAAGGRAASGPARAAQLQRPRSGDLASRFSRERLRRMSTMAFGPLNTLDAHANDVIAEMQGQRAPSAGDPQQEGDEAVRRYIVLREALHKAQEDPAKAGLRTPIERALDMLVGRHGKRIVGDLNIAGSLAQFSGQVHECDQMRRLYHDALCQHPSVAHTFEAILKAFGPGRLEAAVRSLGRALKDDMRSPQCSADPRFLGGLFAELQRVTTILSFMGGAEALQKVFPSLRKLPVRMEFVGRVLRIVVDGASAAQVSQVGQWLASAPQADDPDPAPAAGDAPAVLRHQAAQRRRDDAMRRFLLDVSATLWKPNARASATAIAR